MNDKVKCEFELTDLSKGLSVKDIQSKALQLFITPLVFPKGSLEFRTLEEFILNGED